MATPHDDEPFITADQAIFETELVVHGLAEGGEIGRMEPEEAQKLAVILFSDEEEGMPEEIRQFFRFDEEEGS
jgi:hypothetical protein